MLVTTSPSRPGQPAPARYRSSHYLAGETGIFLWPYHRVSVPVFWDDSTPVTPEKGAQAAAGAWPFRVVAYRA